MTPLFLSLTLQALNGLTDLWVVGNYSGAASITAVANGTQITVLLTLIITGLTTGAAVLGAKAVGDADMKKAGIIAAAEIKLMAAVGVILCVLMAACAQWIVSALNVPDEASLQMTRYVQICSVGMILVTVNNVISSFYRMVGDSMKPLLFILSACIIHIPGVYVSVAVLKMDVTGAGITTVAAQMVSVCTALVYVKKKGLPLTLIWCGNSLWKEIRNILRIGLPVVMNDVFTGISFLAVTGIINSLGLVASASIGIAEKMFVFLALVPTAFLSGLAVFVAQNLGAGKPERGKWALGTATGLSLFFGAGVFFLTYFDGFKLAGIFEKDPAVITAAADYLKGGSFEYLFLSVSYCFQGYFNGMGKTRFVMCLAVITAFFVRIPLTCYFSRQPLVSMFNMGMAVSVSAGAGLLFCLLYYRWNDGRTGV